MDTSAQAIKRMQVVSRLVQGSAICGFESNIHRRYDPCSPMSMGFTKVLHVYSLRPIWRWSHITFAQCTIITILTGEITPSPLTGKIQNRSHLLFEFMVMFL